MSRRNRHDQFEMVLDRYNAEVGDALKRLRAGGKAEYLDIGMTSDPIPYMVRQVIIQAAHVEANKLFDAECAAYEKRIAQRRLETADAFQANAGPVPADEHAPPIGQIPAHLLERAAAARAKRGFPT